MKKIFLLLLIACSLATTVSAQTPKTRKASTDNSPYPIHVMDALNAIDLEYGNSMNRHFEVNRNPNTGIIESRQQIDHFKCGINSPELLAVGKSFLQDEPKSYQFLLITPGKEDLFQLTVPTKDSQRVNRLNLRTNSKQTMWLMCCKNPDNPQLRDAYAIVWERVDETGTVEGDIYKITSLRPDLYERSMESSSSTFRLDGRVGYDLNDSLYIFYVADTYDRMTELSMMTDQYSVLKEYMKTHNDVLPMPVSRNHQFGVTVDIDKPMAGRIRTVMPDGSLCKLWTNIDMIPGETYRITTHNGYYEGDNDYQARLRRKSHRSFFLGHENDDVELTGGYEDDEEYDEDDEEYDEDDEFDEDFWIADTVLVPEGVYFDDDVYITDTVAINDEGDVAIVYDPEASRASSDPFEKLTPEQKATIEAKSMAVRQNIDLTEDLYKMIGTQNEKTIILNGSSKVRKWSSMDIYFKQIYQQNTQLDKQIKELIKLAKTYGLTTQPKVEKEIYKSLLEFFNKQNNHLALISKYGYLSKDAEKTRNQVIKLTEKYLKKTTEVMGQSNHRSHGGKVTTQEAQPSVHSY